MRVLRDVWLGDKRIGRIEFQTTAKAHSALHYENVEDALSEALQVFVKRLQPAPLE